jgi:hypothetical protein
MIYEAPPIPNGYKICDECEMHIHKVGYDCCFHCFGKKNPDLYEKHARNFRATTDVSITEGHQGGVDEGSPDSGIEPASVSPVPGPIDYD